MADIDTRKVWGYPVAVEEEVAHIQKKERRHSKRASRMIGNNLTVETATASQSSIWINSELKQHENTANLDAQQPATLYYLGRLVNDVPVINEVHVEHLERGRRKHWAVLPERDYDLMDTIYEIEEDTINRFPAADISFRTTVSSDDGPSISSQAIKIFES